MKFLVLFLLLSSQAFALNPYSKNAGSVYDKMPKPKKGGTIQAYLGTNPKALNPIIVHEADAKSVAQLIYSRLMNYDYETGEYYPGLAEKIDVSKDRKVVTYALRKNATWHDGTPITTDDVEFTYQKLMDPKVEASPTRATLGEFRLEKLDPRVFRVTFEKPGINSLINFNDEFFIVQKKQFANEDFNKSKANLSPVGSGPYRLKLFSRDQKIVLERVKNWWGVGVYGLDKQFNFDEIVYRIISDRTLAYEKFIKGEIDVFQMNAEMYGSRVKGSDRDRFGTEPGSPKAMWAKHFPSQAPAFYTYIGWNLKSPLFASKKTRQALAHLVDYETIINKYSYGTTIRCLSPFGTLTQNTSPSLKAKAFAFNPKKALELLKADGWADTDGDSVLDKVVNGKKMRFEFTLKHNSENQLRSKIAQNLKEIFRKSGIAVNIQALEWNTYVSELDNRSFDAIIGGWARGNVNPDARQVWHSKSVENKGSNYIAYHSPEVDQLIEQSEVELDIKKRQKIMQRISEIIHDDQPYTFLVEMNGFIMAAQSKIKAGKWSLRYSDEPMISVYSME
jgi:ABC-type transport system substrate-binding protein